MIAGVVLLLISALYRLLPVFLGYTTEQPDWFVNFTPMAALILCGAACLPRRMAIIVPFASLLVTDFILNFHYGASLINADFIAKNLAFAAVATFGWQFRAQPRAKVIIPAVLGASVFFYLVTNSVSWLTDPGYTKSIGGWAQALTFGLPNYSQPTWMFYRNQLVSDLVFSVLFLAFIRSRAERPADIAIRAQAAQW
jgi:hypothetical protein